MPLRIRRLPALLAAALLVVGLAACDQNDGQEPSTTTDAVEDAGDPTLPSDPDAPDPAPTPDAGDGSVEEDALPDDD